MSKIIANFSAGSLEKGLVSLKHTDNGSVIETDIPAEAGGPGQHFCPGDLLVGALAGCSLLTMSEMARHREKSLDGTRIEVEYETAERPTRIGKIKLWIEFPDSVAAEDRKKYLAAINACPIHNSLNKDMTIEIGSN